MESNKTYEMLSSTETESISRALLLWLNKYPDKPMTINYEFLDADSPGMALSTIQGAYKTKSYVRGSYLGQYQFKIIYRTQPGNSNNNRLRADEVLNSLGEWAEKSRPFPIIGIGRRVMKITINALSSVFANYEDGSEDHQILMTLDYSSMK